jgi:hypothetical protein
MFIVSPPICDIWNNVVINRLAQFQVITSLLLLGCCAMLISKFTKGYCTVSPTRLSPVMEPWNHEGQKHSILVTESFFTVFEYVQLFVQGVVRK